MSLPFEGHVTTRSPQLKRGDPFEVVLVQMKGGSARLPSMKERRRLREVAAHYRARHVVLFQWRKGQHGPFFTLRRNLEWKPSTGAALFGYISGGLPRDC